MGEFLIRFAVAMGVFLVVDLLWLGVIARSFYSKEMGDLLSNQTIWPAAILFYVLFVIGLLYFAIYPGLDAGSLQETLRNGALFGFFTYMTYELTNLAVVSGWPAKLVVVDIIWGVVLATTVSWVTYLIFS